MQALTTSQPSSRFQVETRIDKDFLIFFSGYLIYCKERVSRGRRSSWLTTPVRSLDLEFCGSANCSPFPDLPTNSTPWAPFRYTSLHKQVTRMNMVYDYAVCNELISCHLYLRVRDRNLAEISSMTPAETSRTAER